MVELTVDIVDVDTSLGLISEHDILTSASEPVLQPIKRPVVVRPVPHTCPERLISCVLDHLRQT